MSTSVIDALSPLDGRYAGKLAQVRNIFSEAGLMRERVRVECAWLLALRAGPAAQALRALPPAAQDLLRSLSQEPAPADIAAIKRIEARTNHDVKAVEYWLRSELQRCGAAEADLEWLHFGCTSEDINNLAYALMLKAARTSLVLPSLDGLIASLDAEARRHAAVAMLSRTHGQTATPTTVGKEFVNFAARLRRQRAAFESVAILGKINGAVGNYNAHVVALPEVDWPSLCCKFVESLGMQFNALTTQIEPHDWIAEYCQAMMRINTVLLDLARDLWSYISLGYFRQRALEGEVGSSTMPHKVNPIDFENAEGNLGVANALLGHFAEKLPVSRWQRDLSDSTVLRNLGVAVGHSALAYQSLAAGLGKIQLDPQRVAADLDRTWEVLAEAVQTAMRAQGIPDAYDQLKAFTRGRPVDEQALRAFIAALALPAELKQRLLRLTPATYTGLAAELVLQAR